MNTLKKLGKVLNQKEQKHVLGGRKDLSYEPDDPNRCNNSGGICTIHDDNFGLFIEFCCDDGPPNP